MLCRLVRRAVNVENVKICVLGLGSVGISNRPQPEAHFVSVDASPVEAIRTSDRWTLPGC